MSTWDVQDHYYSGQGVVMAAERDALGRPKGFTGFGNCSDLKISVATTVLEHKESHTGARGTDLRLTTETKVTLSMTLENFIADNLSQSLRGTVTKIAGSAVNAENLKAYLGKVSSLKNIKVNSVVLKIGTTELVQYTDDDTAYDFLVNEAAGSVKFNDGSLIPLATLTGVSATAVTVGATTKITVPNTAVAGDKVTLTSFTGADAALLNGKQATVLSATANDVTVDIVTTGKTITTGVNTKVGFDGVAVTAAYNFADQVRVDALTSGAKELALRFEGLNTAEDNSPVVVDVFKFNTDPLKELALIGDTIGQFVLDGSVLADTVRIDDSKYFSVRKLN